MELEINKIYYGFKLLDWKYLKSIESNVYYFEHEKSGAKLAAVKNTDENKAFNISFRTLPEDSTGIAHILEHCVLSGSRKYPVKDVFGELIKGGLSTFMNAFTAPDNTSYPFATRNTKEFFNLLDVYLDTTLNPLLTEDSFKQEGWHYELLEEGSEVEYKGIVFNEMKGAMSDPVQQLLKQLKGHLLKNTIYEYNSGGEPSEIPQLSYQKFKEFHKKYYHPSNSALTLYGNGVLSDELKFIDSYLNEFTITKIHHDIGKLEKITKNETIHVPYAISDEDHQDKVLVGQAYNISQIDDLEINFAFHLISNLVFNSEASSLKNKILESGLVRNFSSFFYDTLKYTSLYLFFQGVKNSKDSGDKLKSIVREELLKLVDKGIDKELLISEFNLLELAKSEELINANKFHIYLSQTKYAMLGGYDLFASLDIMSRIHKLKDKIINTNYLTELIKEYLLNSTQSVTIQLNPDTSLAAKKMMKEKDKLKKYQKSLSDEERANLIIESKRLIDTQNKPEDPNKLALIPKIKSNDVSPTKLFDHPEIENLGGYRLLHTVETTNDLVYFNLGFDLSNLPFKYVKYLDLFSEILISVGTKKRSFQELAKDIYTWSGGLKTQLKFYTQKENSQRFKPYFWLGTKFLRNNAANMLDLINEIINEVNIENTKKIKEILLKIYNHKESDFNSSGLSYVIKRLASYEDLPGQLVEESVGFENLRFLKELVENYEERLPELKESLNFLAAFLKSTLGNYNSTTIHLTACKESLNIIRKELQKFLEQNANNKQLTHLHEGKTLCSLKFNKPLHENEAFLTNSDVVYAGMGANLYKFGLKYHGSFEVALKYLSLDFLMHRIRILGGAYGVMLNFAEKRGLIYLCSYRDPNITETYEAYSDISEALNNFKMSTADFDYLKLGAYADFNQLHSPFEKGEIARDNYMGGFSSDYYMKIMEEILNTEIKNIKSYASIFKDMADKGHISIIGNTQKIKKEGKRFNRLLKL